MGITRKTLARWRGIHPWWNLPKTAVKALDRTEAARIYKALFWDVCGAGKLPRGVDLCVFDFAVNSGPQRAVKALQSALRVSCLMRTPAESMTNTCPSEFTSTFSGDWKGGEMPRVEA